jgi:glyoxylase-like metal-dependent hydrolase (beta-lactamase superfamily II)
VIGWALVSAVLFAGSASVADPFERVWCLRYAFAEEIPTSTFLAGVAAGETITAPFAMCVAQRGEDVVVLDAGYVRQELGEPFNAKGWTEYASLLAEIGLTPEQVDYVTISHMHWDHAGGTSRFPNAKIIVQRDELEFAAGAMPSNSAARSNFNAEDVLDMVKLNWEGRVVLVDGDIEDLVPGLDAYLTPGHTNGTMTICLDTVGGRVCYASDAVYMYRNLDEEIPIGIALNVGQAVESYKKIRRVLRGGILIPGHEPRLFEDAKSLGFRKISDHAVAIVE